MEDEPEIIERILSGDTEAFGCLVRRYQGPILCFAQNILRDPAESEDVSQEVFLAAYVNLGRFDPRRARFSTWLFAIARNKCLTALEGRRRRAVEPGARTVEFCTPESAA